MNFSNALDKTLDKYGIAGKWLSSESGVSERMISNFRNGKQRVWSDSLERIISALPIDSRQYFFAQFLDSPIPVQHHLEYMVSTMDLMEVSQIMALLSRVIATKSRESAESQQHVLKL